jgi:prevent-host-death family protein
LLPLLFSFLKSNWFSRIAVISGTSIKPEGQRRVYWTNVSTTPKYGLEIWPLVVVAGRSSSSARQSQAFLLQCSHVATFEGLVTMSITKLSSRDFNQDTSRAKRAAKGGPVFITNRGRPSHVLLTVEEYQRITGGQKSVVDLLAMPAAAEIEFEPSRLRGNLHESVDLT